MQINIACLGTQPPWLCLILDVWSSWMLHLSTWDLNHLGHLTIPGGQPDPLDEMLSPRQSAGARIVPRRRHSVHSRANCMVHWRKPFGFAVKLLGLPSIAFIFDRWSSSGYGYEQSSTCHRREVGFKFDADEGSKTKLSIAGSCRSGWLGGWSCGGQGILTKLRNGLVHLWKKVAGSSILEHHTVEGKCQPIAIHGKYRFVIVQCF